jgi:hypothetical protein
MMKLTSTLLLLAFSVAPIAAQGQGRARARDTGVPPGLMPPPGLCRVWYNGTPPGRQPRPVSCREAERIASRSRNARVIYSDRWGRNDRYFDADRNGDWDASRYYRRDDRRRPQRLGRNDRIYRGTDNRYNCRRDDGTTGLIVGGISGGVLGNIIAPGGSKTIGTIIGAAAGAAIGKAVDDGDIVCR